MFRALQTFDWKTPYPFYFGGIVGMHRKHWAVINGMGNQFKGWGGEDDDLWRRVVHRALVADCNYPFPRRPEGDDGHVMAISQDKEHHHERDLSGEKEKLHQRNVGILENPGYSGVSNSIIDGWNNAHYNVTSHISEFSEEFPGFEAIHHIKIFPMTQFMDISEFKEAIQVRMNSWK